MNIGIVTTWFERGAAYVSRQFMDVLTQQGHNVFIYARAGEKYAKKDPKWNLPNVYWGRRNLGKLAIIGTYIYKGDFEKWINKNKLEAVLFNEQNWLTPVLWCKDMGVKSIAYVDYYNSLTIPLFDIYDSLICNTKRHAFAFRHHRNVNYLKWGTNITVYKPCADEHEKITFFNSAGMDPRRKGSDYAIKAFSLLNDRRNAKLVIHTQVNLKQECPEIAELIDELIQEGSLEVIEKSVSAPGLYYLGDVYVYPSRLDGIGLTLMEAISSGLACITVNNGPMNEFIEDSFGTLCDVDYYYSRFDGYYWPMCEINVKSLASLMNDFVCGCYDIKKMKKEARAYAEKELDFVNNMKQLGSIIEKSKFEPISKTQRKNVLEYSKRGINKFAPILAPFYNIRYILSGNK